MDDLSSGGRGGGEEREGGGCQLGHRGLLNLQEAWARCQGRLGSGAEDGPCGLWRVS